VDFDAGTELHDVFVVASGFGPCLLLFGCVLGCFYLLSHVTAVAQPPWRALKPVGFYERARFFEHTARVAVEMGRQQTSDHAEFATGDDGDGGHDDLRCDEESASGGQDDDLALFSRSFSAPRDPDRSGQENFPPTIGSTLSLPRLGRRSSSSISGDHSSRSVESLGQAILRAEQAALDPALRELPTIRSQQSQQSQQSQSRHSFGSDAPSAASDTATTDLELSPVSGPQGLPLGLGSGVGHVRRGSDASAATAITESSPPPPPLGSAPAAHLARSSTADMGGSAPSSSAPTSARSPSRSGGGRPGSRALRKFTSGFGAPMGSRSKSGSSSGSRGTEQLPGEETAAENPITPLPASSWDHDDGGDHDDSEHSARPTGISHPPRSNVLLHHHSRLKPLHTPTATPTAAALTQPARSAAPLRDVPPSSSLQLSETSLRASAEASAATSAATPVAAGSPGSHDLSPRLAPLRTHCSAPSLSAALPLPQLPLRAFGDGEGADRRPGISISSVASSRSSSQKAPPGSRTGNAAHRIGHKLTPLKGVMSVGHKAAAGLSAAARGPAGSDDDAADADADVAFGEARPSAQFGPGTVSVRERPRSRAEVRNPGQSPMFLEELSEDF
jgi:hypothetical protein